MAKTLAIRILENVAKGPTNEHFLASDFRVKASTIDRAVRALIRQGALEHEEYGPGYAPRLSLTAEGRQLLRESKPGWWQTRGDAASRRRSPSRDPRKRKGLVRVILPSGNPAVYSVTAPGESDPERIRHHHTHIATKIHGEWRERGADWRRAHESDARSYDRAPLVT